jgi:hypothetical protein
MLSRFFFVHFADGGGSDAWEFTSLSGHRSGTAEYCTAAENFSVVLHTCS